MSKLSKELRTNPTGNKKISKNPIISTKETVLENKPLDSVEYKMDVRIGVTFLVSHNSLTQSSSSIDIFSYEIQKAKQRIIEEIFGEFRLPLLRLREYINKQDFSKASIELDNIFQEMFDV